MDGLVEQLFDGAGFDHLPEAVGSRLRRLRRDVVAELVEVYRSDLAVTELPPTAPRLADLAAWGIQQRIAFEEVPELARAVHQDKVDGANRHSRGEEFVHANRALVAEIRQAGERGSGIAAAGRAELGLRALDAFDRAGVGAEELAEDGTSDQLISTAAAAAGIAATVLDGELPPKF